MKIVADKTNHSVSVTLEQGFDIQNISQASWLELASEEMFDSFCFNAQRIASELTVTYSLPEACLLSSVLEQADEAAALDSITAFVQAVFEGNLETDRLLGFDTVFCKDNTLHFIKALVPQPLKKAQVVKDFILAASESVPAFDEVLLQQLLEAGKSENAPEAIASYIETYRNPPATPAEKSAMQAEAPKEQVCPACGAEFDKTANFCLYCGAKLALKQSSEAAQSDPAPEPQPEPAQVQVQEEARAFAETTLLGLTNVGETSVLGGSGFGNFAIPFFIREATGEKILISKRSFIIGKSAEQADYAVPNSAVSRVHAEVSVIGTDYFLIDKNSTNHTYVNEQMIPANSSVQIFDGDAIKFANENFVFHLQ